MEVESIFGLAILLFNREFFSHVDFDKFVPFGESYLK